MKALIAELDFPGAHSQLENLPSEDAAEGEHLAPQSSKSKSGKIESTTTKNGKKISCEGDRSSSEEDEISSQEDNSSSKEDGDEISSEKDRSSSEEDETEMGRTTNNEMTKNKMNAANAVNNHKMDNSPRKHYLGKCVSLVFGASFQKA